MRMLRRETFVAQIKKYGNSIGIVLPSHVRKRLDLSKGDYLDVTVLKKNRKVIELNFKEGVLNELLDRAWKEKEQFENKHKVEISVNDIFQRFIIEGHCFEKGMKPDDLVKRWEDDVLNKVSKDASR